MPDAYTFPAGYTFASIASGNALHLDLTGESIAAGGAAQSRTWTTQPIPVDLRLTAIVVEIDGAIQFTVPDASKTILLIVRNDNGDTLLSTPIDIEHVPGSSQSIGRVPLVVGPFAINGTTNPLPFSIVVSTDAASLGLVNPAVGAVWIELVLQSVNVTDITPTITPT